MVNYTILNFHVYDSPGTLLATADVSFDNAITICGVKLVAHRAREKTFLALPTHKAGNRYYPDAVITNKKLRKRLEQDFQQRYIHAARGIRSCEG